MVPKRNKKRNQETLAPSPQKKKSTPSKSTVKLNNWFICLETCPDQNVDNSRSTKQRKCRLNVTPPAFRVLLGGRFIESKLKSDQYYYSTVRGNLTKVVTYTIDINSYHIHVLINLLKETNWSLIDRLRLPIVWLYRWFIR